MMHRLRRAIPFLLLAASAAPAYALTATIDTSAAKAVLSALQDPALSQADALSVAALPGNQGMIRKLNEFKIPATTAKFASALVAAAHGVVPTDSVEQAFYLEMVRAKIPQLQALLAQMEADPAAFQGAIERRIGLYAPSHADIKLAGYVVAAGDGGGYAFNGTDFYLNIGIIDEFVVAKSVTTHELYHAVQGAYAHARDKPDAGPAQGRSSAQVACDETNRLFANIYKEGSAVEVADPTLIDQARSAIGLHIRDDTNDRMKHLDDGSTLLEMSVLSLTADQAIPYDAVYPIDFLGHGVLYGIAYVIAKAIADNDGPQGLAVFLQRPPSAFLLRYTELPRYGADKMHPKLGPHTVAALLRVAHDCQ